MAVSCSTAIGSYNVESVFHASGVHKMITSGWLALSVVKLLPWNKVNLHFFFEKKKKLSTSRVKCNKTFFLFFSSSGVEGKEAISAKKQKI